MAKKPKTVLQWMEGAEKIVKKGSKWAIFLALAIVLGPKACKLGCKANKGLDNFIETGHFGDEPTGGDSTTPPAALQLSTEDLEFYNAQFQKFERIQKMRTTDPDGYKAAIDSLTARERADYETYQIELAKLAQENSRTGR